MHELEQLCLNKINNCEVLTESELEHLVRSHEIERKRGQKRKQCCTITSYIELDDRYFCIVWNEIIAKDDEFNNQPYEVEEYTYDKVVQYTVAVKGWKPKLI